MKKNYLLGISTVIVVASVIALLIYHLLFTTKGSNSIAKLAFSKYIPSESIDFEDVNGNLMQKLSYKNITFNNLKFLPEGNILKIQKLNIFLASLGLAGLNINVYNGILRIPNFDIILFYGTSQDGNLGIHVYSKNVSIQEVLDLFIPGTNFKKISGTISNCDICIKGAFSEPELTGTFKIDRLIRGSFSITSLPGNFNLRFKNIKNESKLFGSVFLSGGVISGPKTALVNIQESRVTFKGILKNPSLDLKGSSTVEGARINITLKGTFEKPELKLTSDPPRSQERLLIMLATGKNWKGAEGSLSQGQLSADLVKDFVDYFFFTGVGGKLARKLGVKDFSIKSNSSSRGVSFKKDLNGRTEVLYGVDQSNSKDSKYQVTQKVGVGYKLTENISLNAEQEIKQKGKNDNENDELKEESNVKMQFKKEF